MRNSATVVEGARTQVGGSSAIKNLVGAGDKIGKVVLPFLALGVAANIWRPSLFAVGGPSAGLRIAALAVLGVGVVMWLWSVVLILTRVPRGELITSGPFALVKHPLYTGVSLLVLPAVGVLLNTWLGAALGAVIYIAARRYAPAEEIALSEAFGAEWDAYEDSVALPWL